jgi:hypothetical protein
MPIGNQNVLKRLRECRYSSQRPRKLLFQQYFRHFSIFCMPLLPIPCTRSAKDAHNSIKSVTFRASAIPKSIEYTIDRSLFLRVKLFPPIWWDDRSTFNQHQEGHGSLLQLQLQLRTLH